MTREEICNSMTLQDAIQVFRDTNAYGTMDIAKSVILKALERKTSDDCISRKAVLDLVADYDLSMGQVVKGIHNLPSVTPQPRFLIHEDGKMEQINPQQKTGHWIEHRRVDGKEEEYIVPIENGAVRESCICSECKEWLTGSDEYVCGGRYCPSCGAKMESEAKE